MTALADVLWRVLALREGYPEGTCWAWMDGAERVCGRPEGDALHLCQRHAKVAESRLHDDVERAERRRVRQAERAAVVEPGKRAELDRIERRLDALDPLRSGSLDPAVVNLPLAKRLPSDARIAELARLHERRRQLRRELGLR